MIKEIKENNIYKMIDDGEVILTIESLGDNVYKATNKNSIVVGKIVPLDEYRTELTLIENKKVDKNGCYRKSKTLANHNLSWLHSMVELKGFIRKSKPIK